MVRIKDASDLPLITDLVHDLLFDVEELIGHAGPTLHLSLWQGKRTWLWESGHQRVRRGSLIVHSVQDTIVVDSEHVGYYDIKTLVYEPPFLRIVTEIPIDVRIRVSQLDIELTGLD